MWSNVLLGCGVHMGPELGDQSSEVVSVATLDIEVNTVVTE